MNRNFAILGLREDATKEQVKQAYELRMRKYRSSDYDDDPDYAKRKIEELKRAYDAAYSVAGTDQAYNREEDSYRWDDYDRDEFERDGDRGTRRGDAHRFKTPDISKLKGKMDSLKNTVSENMGELTESIRNTGERRDEASEGGSSHTGRTSAGVRKLADDRSGRIVEPETAPPAQSSGPPRLEDSGSGRVIQTPVGANSTPYNGDSSPIVKGGSIAGTIIALLVAFVMMFASMCDDGPEYDDDGYVDTGYYGYSYEYNSDSDQRIYNTAIDANDLLNEQDDDVYTSEGYSEEDVKKEANRFAKNYLKMDSIEEVTEYLYENYDEYGTYTDESYEEQITQILAFYGFMTEYDAEGRISPYTGEPIADLLEYIKYINRYYRENGLATEDEDI